MKSLAAETDGRTVVGGQFTMVGGQTRNYIGRLDADGLLDGFNPGANSNVTCVAVQADGKLLVGGEFTRLAGQTRNYIGRVNANGSLDPLNPGANGNVICLAVQADEKILAGGAFTLLGGQPRNYLARLNPDGTVDTFNPAANGPIPLTVLDGESASSSLTVSAAAANPSLVAPGGFVFGGSGANRTLTITPAPNQRGSTVITVTISDGTAIATRSFLLSVGVVPGDADNDGR